VTDRVLLGASLRTFYECLDLAKENEVGLEVQAFAYPDVLDGDWRGLVEEYRTALADLPGELAMHGPFLDMASGSPDSLVRNAVQQRLEQSLEIAAMLSAHTVVFHANFIATIRNQRYRTDWTARQVEFWGPLAERAQGLGLTLALENMWEFDPYIIQEVLRQVDSPALMACLDVGHAMLFSSIDLDTWLEVMAPFLVHTHLNNNLGEIDEHLAFDDGVLDYHEVLRKLRDMPLHPAFSLEIERVDDIRRSLPYLQLPRSAKLHHESK
jgi:sugar phosphate isomerase/epimerase